MKHPLQQARFVATAANDSQLPPSGPPEIAFAGRSNAGKSSAINALANQTRLAFTSKTPGRTQHINFFELRSGALLADLPGYGYAAVPQELKRHWQEFLWRYVATRQALVGLVLVIDVRRGISALDLDLLSGYLPSGRPVLVLATKSDKLSASAQREAERQITQHLATGFPAHRERIRVIAFSATRRVGIERAEDVFREWLGIDPAEQGSLPRGRDGAVPEPPKKRPRHQGE